MPGHGAALTTALPMLIAGIASGFVISPDQTLTLAQVPPAEGGSAAGVLQTGQGIGSAVGIAAVGAVFFSTLAGTRSYARAFQDRLLIILAAYMAAIRPFRHLIVYPALMRQIKRIWRSPRPLSR